MIAEKAVIGLIVTIVLILVAGACLEASKPKVHTGRVVAKHYDPPRTSWSYAPVFGGKGGGALVPVAHPGEFILIISDGEHESRWSVPEAEYNQAQIGLTHTIRDQ